MGDFAIFAVKTRPDLPLIDEKKAAVASVGSNEHAKNVAKMPMIVVGTLVGMVTDSTSPRWGETTTDSLSRALNYAVTKTTLIGWQARSFAFMSK